MTDRSRGDLSTSGREECDVDFPFSPEPMLPRIGETLAFLAISSTNNDSQTKPA
jgi:hypothetical protein